MPSNTAARPRRAFTFHPDGWIPIGHSPCKITVLVLNRHSKAAYSGCLSACTAKNTPDTDSDSPSARRPSSGMAGEWGWGGDPGGGGKSSLLFLRLPNLPPPLALWLTPP